jgi:hypothetical protein
VPAQAGLLTIVTISINQLNRFLEKPVIGNLVILDIALFSRLYDKAADLVVDPTPDARLVMSVQNEQNVSNRHITTESEKLIVYDGKVYNVAHDAADVLSTRRKYKAKVLVNEVCLRVLV